MNRNIIIFSILISFLVLASPVLASQINSTGGTVTVIADTYTVGVANNTSFTSYGYVTQLYSNDYNSSDEISGSYIADYVQMVRGNGVDEDVISNLKSIDGLTLNENGTVRTDLEFSWASGEVILNWYFYDDYYVGRFRGDTVTGNFNDGLEVLLVLDDDNSTSGYDRDFLHFAEGTKGTDNTTIPSTTTAIDLFDQTNDYWVAWYGQSAGDLAVGRIGKAMVSGGTNMYSDLTDIETTGSDYFDQYWYNTSALDAYDEMFTITVPYAGNDSAKVEAIYNLYKNPATVDCISTCSSPAFNDKEFIYEFNQTGNSTIYFNVTGDSSWNNSQEKIYIKVLDYQEFDENGFPDALGKVYFYNQSSSNWELTHSNVQYDTVNNVAIFELTVDRTGEHDFAFGFIQMVHSNPLLYNSFADEPQSSGSADSTRPWVGDTVANNVRTSQQLITASPNGFVDILEVNVTNMQGTPEDLEFIYDISICPTSVSSLNQTETNLTIDCDSAFTVVADDVNLSSVYGFTTGLKNISFDTGFIMNNATSYIVMWEWISGGNLTDGNRDDYIFPTDQNPTVSMIKRLENATIAGGSASLSDISLYGNLIENTSIEAVKFNVSADNISSSTMAIVASEEFNTTQSQLNLTFLSNFNLERVVGSGNSDVWARVRVDNATIFEDIVRTVGPPVGEEGSASIPPLVFNVSSGNHTIDMSFNRSVSGTIEINDIDMVLIKFVSVKDILIRSQLTNGPYDVSSSSFVPAFNWTVNKTFPSSTYIYMTQVLNASGIGAMESFINHTDDSEISSAWTRSLATALDFGSALGLFLDMNDTETGSLNFSIESRVITASNGTANSTILDFDMADTSTNTVPNFQSSNASTNLTSNLSLTAGTHLLTSDVVTIANGTSYFLSAFMSMGSSSAMQTPTMFVNSTNDTVTNCFSKKERLLTDNNDIGVVGLATTCDNLTVGDDYEFNLYTTVEATETMILLDEAFQGFETTPFDIATIPVDQDGDGFFSIPTGGTDCNDLNATQRPLVSGGPSLNVNDINTSIEVCTGAYRNLTVNITQPNLIFDGNFSTMNSALLTLVDQAIIVTGQDNTTIRNIDIGSYGTGVNLTNSNNTILITNGLFAKNNFNAILMNNSHNAFIANNEIGIVDNGIRLYDADNNNITNNTITGTTDFGIWLESGSTNNTIFNNTINLSAATGTPNGIRLVASDDNLISTNNLTFINNIAIDINNLTNVTVDNNWLFNTTNGAGIGLNNTNASVISNNFIDTVRFNGISIGGSGGVANQGSFNNNVTNNTILDTFELWGIRVSRDSNFTLIEDNFVNASVDANIRIGSSHNRILNNTANFAANEGILVGEGTGTVGGHNNTIDGNNFNDNSGAGIMFFSTNTSVFSNNNMLRNSADGITEASGDSFDNNITGNNVTNNGATGIQFENPGPTGNLIFNNFISGNLDNVIDNGVGQDWNTTQQTGPNIIGGQDIGGNFYSNYTGVDDNGDGIGDTPFTISGTAGSIDQLPLTNESTPEQGIDILLLAVAVLLIVLVLLVVLARIFGAGFTLASIAQAAVFIMLMIVAIAAGIGLIVP